MPVEGDVLTGTIPERNRKSTHKDYGIDQLLLGIINTYLAETMKGKGIINHQFKAKCEGQRAYIAIYSFSFPTVRGQKMLRVRTRT